MVGMWSNKVSREELKAGDHIYTWRHSYLYSHHGIYIGEGKVIHFTRGAGNTVLGSHPPQNSCDKPCSRSRCGGRSRLGGVISSCIDCFLLGDELYLFQYGVSPALFLGKARGGTCTLATSGPPNNVLHRATFLLSNGFGVYHTLNNNCEDFAIYCKTGLPVLSSMGVGLSGQTATLLAAAAAAAAAFVSSPLLFLLRSSYCGLVIVDCGIYCVGRLVSDIGVRSNVITVPVERLN